MSKLDKMLRAAVTAQDVPFVVAMAGSASEVTYSGAFGQAAPGLAAQEDTVFRIFSMTKSIGSAAAMILIERGLLDVDTPVGEILPAWNTLPVLDGWDGDTPLLRSQKTVATVRHLATHTSGIEYEFYNADLSRYLTVTGKPSVMSGLKEALHYPLTSDPGTRWGYGPSTDWLGQVVEKVDGRTIDVFCQEEILNPLGMHSTSFEPSDLTDRLSSVSMRDEDGDFAPFEIAPPPSPEFYGMGSALYSTAPDYLTFLQMILGKGSLKGLRILSEASVDLMLQDHMQGLTCQRLVSGVPALTRDVVMPKGSTHSFGFVRSEADIPGGRRAGSQSWAGACNTHYWIDPAANLAAVIMTQSLPFFDERFMRTYRAYERALYAQL